MPQIQGSGSSACGPPGLKACVLLIAFLLSAYILGPPLYWHFMEGVASLKHTASSSSCPPCAACDCPLDNASILPPGFGNNSAECTKAESKMQDELEKSAVDLLTEELKLQANVADESQQRADTALLEAKKLSSQYQKEAEKCNAGMETCEEAREKAEEELLVQQKISSLWERRARELGWKSG